MIFILLLTDWPDMSGMDSFTRSKLAPKRCGTNLAVSVWARRLPTAAIKRSIIQENFLIIIIFNSSLSTFGHSIFSKFTGFMATIFCYLLFDSNHLQFAGFSSISETIAHKDILTAAGSSGAEVLQHLSVTSKKAFTMTPQPIYSTLPKYFN
ncbi:hypothetical protein D3C86_1507100 [compost metagenome]